MDAAFRTILWRLLAVGGGILALTTGVCWLVARDITGSLGRLKGVMQRLAGGDLAVNVVGTDRRDAVGEMADAVQVFKVHAVEMDRLKAEQKEVEKRAAEEKQKAVQQLARDFEASVGEVVKTVSSSATEMGSTAASMNATAERTSKEVTAVAAASEQASTNVQSVASAVQQLSSSVGEISRQITTSSAIAMKAVGDAEHTNTLVAALAGAQSRSGLSPR
jgi:methyl-accepting chemotaxis protein